MPRYDESNLFKAYLQTLVNEKDKNAKPDFADIDGDGDEKESAKKAAKEKDEGSEEGGSGNLDKLPPALRKHMMKKKGLKEHHGGEFSDGILNMRVGDLLDDLEKIKDDELWGFLYAELEQWIRETYDSGRGMITPQDDFEASLDADPDYDEDRFHDDPRGGPGMADY
jgi:hypothetical protein